MLAVAALGTGLTTACSDESSTGPAYLFIVHAPVGTVVEGTSGFELVVPADSSVTWFTDRPFRQAGNITLTQLADSWEADGYSSEPPQAGLDLFIDGSDATFVVELGVPRLDGTEYHIPMIDVQAEDTSGAEHAGQVATMGVAVGRLEEVSMFIDSTSDCSICEGAGE